MPITIKTYFCKICKDRIEYNPDARFGTLLFGLHISRKHSFALDNKRTELAMQQGGKELDNIQVIETFFQYLTTRTLTKAQEAERNKEYPGEKM